MREAVKAVMDGEEKDMKIEELKDWEDGIRTASTEAEEDKPQKLSKQRLNLEFEMQGSFKPQQTDMDEDEIEEILDDPEMMERRRKMEMQKQIGEILSIKSVALTKRKHPSCVSLTCIS